MKKLIDKVFRAANKQGSKNSETLFFSSSGQCPTCNKEVEFNAREEYLREHLLCSNCGSLPRERALMVVIDQFFPRWRESIVHETSPAPRGASIKLAKECNHYIPSRYFERHRPGTLVDGMRCENLEALTFDDESIELHVSQDVVEHIFHPARAFREIARTLKPGGMHIFSVPIVNKDKPSARRARLEDGEIEHLVPAQYHGDGFGGPKSLVTVDWGYDICRHIFEASGLFTHIVHIDDVSRGIKADLIEILVTTKPETCNLNTMRQI
jgi:SAM-dependent methyltransferase